MADRNPFHSVLINHLDGVYQFRSKLFRAFVHLSGDKSVSACIAADFSTLGKSLIRSVGGFQSQIEIDSSESSMGLAMSLHVPRASDVAVQRMGMRAGFFVLENKEGWEFRKQYRLVSLLSSQSDLESAMQLLASKTREELFADLNHKNSQLQVEIEERKIAQQTLQDTQRDLIENEKLAALGGLVAGIAHEINTPVGIGVTASSHLRETLDHFSELYVGGKMKRSDLDGLLVSVRDLNGMVEENLQRASSLIRSFKEVAVDQTAEDEREFCLSEYASQVVKSLSPQLRNRKIEISLQGIDPSIHLHTAPGPISQVLVNLVNNSLVHGFDEDQSGMISIGARLTSDGLHLTYADNGKGIAPENQGKIFDPFFTTKRSHGGSGLGMHLVYNIVTKKYSGKIKCESEIGQGVRFDITLMDVFGK